MCGERWLTLGVQRDVSRLGTNFRFQYFCHGVGGDSSQDVSDDISRRARERDAYAVSCVCAFHNTTPKANTRIVGCRLTLGWSLADPRFRVFFLFKIDTYLCRYASLSICIFSEEAHSRGRFERALVEPARAQGGKQPAPNPPSTTRPAFPRIPRHALARAREREKERERERVEARASLSLSRSRLDYRKRGVLKKRGSF